MKILAIRLKNLTSIEGTVEVDFTAEPLRSAGIYRGLREPVNLLYWMLYVWRCMIRRPVLLLRWKA